jgi:hypothetical protein
MLFASDREGKMTAAARSPGGGGTARTWRRRNGQDIRMGDSPGRFALRGWRTATNVQEEMVTVRQIYPRGAAVVGTALGRGGL